jgi:hypothetical protein
MTEKFSFGLLESVFIEELYRDYTNPLKRFVSSVFVDCFLDRYDFLVKIDYKIEGENVCVGF